MRVLIKSLITFQSCFKARELSEIFQDIFEIFIQFFSPSFQRFRLVIFFCRLQLSAHAENVYLLQTRRFQRVILINLKRTLVSKLGCSKVNTKISQNFANHWRVIYCQLLFCLIVCSALDANFFLHCQLCKLNKRYRNKFILNSP